MEDGEKKPDTELGRNRSTPEADAFWDHVERTAAEVREREAERDARRRSQAFITHLNNERNRR